MSSLPNLREYNNVNLAELLSDSEDLLTAKFEEQTRWRWEVRKHEEHERQE